MFAGQDKTAGRAIMVFGETDCLFSAKNKTKANE